MSMRRLFQCKISIYVLCIIFIVFIYGYAQSDLIPTALRAWAGGMSVKPARKAYRQKGNISPGNIEDFYTRRIQNDRTIKSVTLLSAVQRQVELRSPSKLFLKRYSEYENDTIHVSPFYILRDFPFWMTMHIPVKEIQFLSMFKNPCFFAEAFPGACTEVTYTQCTDAILHCLPYFILAGFAKGGTTDICSKLGSHQQVVTSDDKEIYWWDNKFIRYGNSSSLIGYTSRFARLAQKVLADGINFYDTSKRPRNRDLLSNFITGDCSPTTAKTRGSWEKDPLNYDKTTGEIVPRYLMPHKVHHLLPNSKVLFTIRDPSPRALSKFNNIKTPISQAVGEKKFHSLIRNGINWFTNCGRLYSTERCALSNQLDKLTVSDKGAQALVRTGLYSVYLKKWIEVFSKENLLFIKFDSYIEDPVTYLSRRVLPFLNLDPFEEKIRAKLLTLNGKNRSKRGIVMGNETRILLDGFFKPYNQELINLLGTEFKWNT